MTNPETLGLRKKDEQREIQENCIYVGYLQTANCKLILNEKKDIF
jgi:hypothetical protein